MSLTPRSRSEAQKFTPQRDSVLLLRKSFWAALILPFMADVFLNAYLLTSLLGAALWAVLIMLSAWKSQTRDTRLQSLIGKAQILLWTFFVGSWIYIVFKAYTHQESAVQDSLTWLHPLSTAWLFRIHALLLAGASGLVLLFGVSAWLTQMQYSRLNTSSWQRRQHKSFWKHLPSLESLLNMSSRAVFWAFTCWGLGFALAILTLLTTYSVGFNAATLSTLLDLSLDPKIILTGFLWSLLFLAFLVQNRSSWTQSKRSVWLSSLAIVFWICLSLQAFILNSPSFHEPVRWFLK